MIDRDGDSDFTTGSIDFYKLDQSFGELVRTNSIDFSDGDVFTIAVARNISVQTGDWDDPDTWLLGVPVDDEGVAIISTHVVSLTQDESIGNLTISAGAELRLGSNTLSVTQGTILNAGTFTAQTGTVEYSSGGSQCISPLNYFNLYLTGSGTKTLCGDVFIQNDIQILGIGRTGHIGFNEPGSWEESTTRLVRLDNITREDATSDFINKEVPYRAITMGISSIMKAREIYLLAWGLHKASIIQKAIEGPISSSIPATFLQNHSNTIAILDEQAAEELTRRRAPWLVGMCDWTDDLIAKAVVWLSQKLNKPILRLTDVDYNENGLSELIVEHADLLAHRIVSSID